MRRFIYTFILFIATTLTTLAQKPTGETVRTEDFTQIIVAGNFNIHLSQGDECLYHIAATDHTTLSIVNAVSKKGALVIGYNKKLKKTLKASPLHNIDIYITIKELKKLTISGGCVASGASAINARDLQIKSTASIIENLNITTKTLTLTLKEVSKAELALQAVAVSAKLKGMSALTIDGNAEKANFTAADVSIINASNFLSNTSSVSLAGMSSATVNSRKSLNANLKGSCKLQYIERNEARDINSAGKFNFKF